MPAASLHSTARDLAVFYQMLLNGGEYAGHRYLKEDTIRAAITPGYQGLDHFYHRPARWAYGFHVNQIHSEEDGEHRADMGSGASLRAFGHFGMASCVVFADPEADLVFAFACNRLLNKSGDRAQALLHALWKAVK
jgi:CubicO group peptidase (beta-lactamase class C family)